MGAAISLHRDQSSRSPPPAGKEVLPIEGQPWFGRSSRRLRQPLCTRTRFRGCAGGRFFLDPGGRWYRHGGQRLPHRLLRFFGRRLGLCHFRNIGAWARVEDDLLRKTPCRADPDGRPVGIGRACTLDGRRQVPVRCEEQRQQQGAHEYGISDDRHGPPLANEGTRFRRGRTSAGGGPLPSAARLGGLTPPLGSRCASTGRPASRARRSRRSDTS